MIIGIDASRANHECKTGVEWYAWHMIAGLKKEISENIQVVLYTDKPLVGELAIMPKNWKEKVLKWPPKRLWTQFRMSLEMFFNPPDVLFIPAHVFPIIHPKKTIMTVHDIAAVRFPESYNCFERWYSVWSARYAVRKLWKVIVPSNFVKKELGIFDTFDCGFQGRVFVVHHGFDSNFKIINDSNKINKVLNKYGLKKPFIMTLGRLETKKNTTRIIEAFDLVRKKITDVELLLVGKPGFGFQEVQKAIDSSPNKKFIIQPGWVDDEDLSYLMNGAGIFLFPSLYEGFGIPVLEAMACGTPVVTSFGSSLDEIGGNAVVYVNPEKTDDIAKSVINLLEVPALRERCIEAGLEIVEKFSWEQSVQKTKDVIVSRDKV